MHTCIHANTSHLHDYNWAPGIAVRNCRGAKPYGYGNLIVHAGSEIQTVHTWSFSCDRTGFVAILFALKQDYHSECRTMTPLTFGQGIPNCQDRGALNSNRNQAVGG